MYVSEVPSGLIAPLQVTHPGRPPGIVDGPEEMRKRVREIVRAGAKRRLASDVNNREERICLRDIRRKTEFSRRIESEGLIVRGLMPELNARCNVHGEGWAEHL